jgi:hypothetical protein
MRWRLALLSVLMLAHGPAAAEPVLARHALGALPGVYRVATAGPEPVGLAFHTGAGYGYAASVFGTDDTHHRASGALAASFTPVSWLSLGLRMDGRFDQHSARIEQPDGTAAEITDDGLVGDPRFLVQARTSLNESWHLGGRLTLWFPGSEAPSLVLGATTTDALAALTYEPPGSPLRVGLNAGFRLDRSAESAEDAGLLSQADRLSLGVSDSHAVLLGAGATFQAGTVQILGELTWDVLVGEAAPPLRESPLRVAAGMRVPVGENLALELVLESNLARLPTAAPGEPLVPFEPRISVNAGLHFRFGAPARARSGGTDGDSPDEPDEPDGPGTPDAARTGVVHGRVRGAGGVAVTSAVVTVSAGSAQPGPSGDAAPEATPGATPGATGDAAPAATGSAAPTFTTEAKVDAEGRFRVEGVPSGPVTVTARADGFEPVTRSFTLAPGSEHELDIDLERALPPGQLRGFVRSFGGKPVAATLTIEPLGQTITAGEDGAFEIDVGPGRYEVVIRAPGYREQRRSVTIEEGGVLILNVDLRRQK